MRCTFLFGCFLLGLSGCAGDVPDEGQHVEHRATLGDIEFIKSETPLTTDHVVLWVNGLGCPQCASNIDLQLERLPGVDDIRVDLGAGKVDVGLSGSSRPSPHSFAEAVTDAGFTLVKIEARP